MTASHRADVDGLRAIAVLLVVGFHAFPNEVAGGFVGVDIFFVISGFLITGIILSAMQSGTFSFATFYARRARRIFPALALVLISTLAAGWFLLLPVSFAELGRHSLAGALFLENALLFSEVDYFDHAAELKPLLHLWSLGIEEQFYLVWPFALAAAFKRRWSPFVLCVAVFLVSFICNIWVVRVSQPAAFYLPVTRFWELMAGAMLASRLPPPIKPRISEAMAVAGCFMIVLAVAVLNSRALFPGAWALLPVGGTIALLIAGETTWIARCILQRRLLVSLGLISYPLYLWHWPILSLVHNAAIKEPTDLERAGCVVFAIVLSYLTFRFLENPIRRVDVRWRGALVLAGSLAVIAVAGLRVLTESGYPSRFPLIMQSITADYRPEAGQAARLGECFIGDAVPRPTFPASCDATSRRGRVAIWGDSFAASLYPGLRSIMPDGSIGEYTMSGCPPVIGFDSAQRRCSVVAEEVVERVAALKFDTVILAARWTLYNGRDGWGEINANLLASTIVRLRHAGIENIVIVGQLPIWKQSVPKIAARLALLGDSMDSNATYLDSQTFVADARIRDFAAINNVRFVSPLSAFCQNSACRLVVPESGGIPTAYDEGHLTVAASRWFAQARASELGSAGN